MTKITVTTITLQQIRIVRNTSFMGCAHFKKKRLKKIIFKYGKMKS